MRILASRAAPAAADVVIVPIAQDGVADALHLFAPLSRRTAVVSVMKATRFHGREGEVLSLPLAAGALGSGSRRGSGAPRRRSADGAGRTLCLVGLGEGARIDVDAWRRAAGRGRKAAAAVGARHVAILVDDRAATSAHLVGVVEGFRLAGYRFDKYKSAPDTPPAVRALTLVVPPEAAARTKHLAAALGAVDAALAGVTVVRDLVNEPAAAKTPSSLATLAKRLAKDAGIDVEIWGGARLERERMSGLLAVARGSHEKPRFIRLHYAGRGARQRVILVGKGITFDSGGLSLKPAKSMETMKCDMAGGATVLAVMIALGRLRPPIEVEGFIPATENLPGGNAQKPGDVIRYRNGKTVEVLNTDAEGRLILADALALAAARKPDVLIDLATLTGACMIALGPQVAGIFGNYQPLVDRLVAIGREAGEPLWQLPLVGEYRDDIKSAVADLKNIGGGSAGSITAALFLQEFVDGVRWAHLDIAGPAFTEKELPFSPKGGTGFGVRLLLRFLLGMAEDASFLDAPAAVEGDAKVSGRGPNTSGSSAGRKRTRHARRTGQTESPRGRSIALPS